MRFLILALALLGILVSADAANAERRVAFVVGNGTYKNVTPLPNPPIDAMSMAGLLRNAWFDVVDRAAARVRAENARRGCRCVFLCRPRHRR